MDKLTLKTSKFYYNVILAISKNKGIGFKGKLPWELPLDMKHFKTVTSKISSDSNTKLSLMSEKFSLSGKELFKDILNDTDSIPKTKNMVVMGKNTWESLPKKFKPLPDRINVILSRNQEFIKNNPNQEGKFYTASCIDDVFSIVSDLKEKDILNEIFVIGGTNTYDEFLKNYPDQCKIIYQTNIGKDYECDTFFDIPKNFEPIFVSKTFTDQKESRETTLDFRILLNKEILKNKELTKNFDQVVNNYFFDQYPKHEEYQYLEELQDILDNGHSKEDRTGVGTISKFGVKMSFDVSQTFPLLTTKDTFWRGIVEELLWFIKADTNAKHLQDKKVNIWDGNSSREYLDSINLSHREVGDLGPIYGFQWRHFGAEYKTMHDNYTNQGHDQLAHIINQIKTNPNDRRMILSAWNPVDLKKMALPPCHVLSQFYVEDSNKLSLQMYQRSGDMGLGIPFNIASYSLLLRMVAQVTGMKPGKFVHVIGDAHIYKSHVEAVKKQILRTPKPFPILRVNSKVNYIEDFKFEDFGLINYSHWPKIKMDMAV